MHPSTGSNKRRPRWNVSPDHFLRSNVRTNFTIGTPVCGADKHLLINVERQAIPLNVKNSDSNVPSCLALHLSLSLSSYVVAKELFPRLRLDFCSTWISRFRECACIPKAIVFFAKLDRCKIQRDFPFAAETKGEPGERHNFSLCITILIARQ